MVEGLSQHEGPEVPQGTDGQMWKSRRRSDTPEAVRTFPLDFSRAGRRPAAALSSADSDKPDHPSRGVRHLVRAGYEADEDVAAR